MRDSLTFLFLLVLFYSAHIFAAASCSISVPVPISFGVYDPLSPTPDDINGQVEVCCANTPPPNNVPVTVSLSEGASGTFSPRKMFNGTFSLNYNIYLNNPRTQIWGDGTGGTSVWSRNIRAGQCRNRDMRGRIPAGQNQPPGLYVDSITAMVTF